MSSSRREINVPIQALESLAQPMYSPDVSSSERSFHIAPAARLRTETCSRLPCVGRVIEEYGAPVFIERRVEGGFGEKHISVHDQQVSGRRQFFASKPQRSDAVGDVVERIFCKPDIPARQDLADRFPRYPRTSVRSPIPLR